MGREILIKTKKEIDQLEERVVVREPPEGEGSIEVQVGGSDDQNSSISPKSDFKSTKESSDTVYGQGTNPKPEDETYLSLLKGTTSVRAKVKIKEEDDEEDREEIEIRISSDSGKQASADLNPSYYSGPKPK